MKYLKSKAGGVQIEITVTPNARQTEVVGVFNDLLKLKIHAPPVDGKANQEIIRFFSELFKCKKKDILILRGEKAHNKIIFLSTVTLSEAKNKLNHK